MKKLISSAENVVDGTRQLKDVQLNFNIKSIQLEGGNSNRDESTNQENKKV